MQHKYDANARCLCIYAQNSCISVICVVSDGLFLNVGLLCMLYLVECVKYTFNIPVVSDGIYP